MWGLMKNNYYKMLSDFKLFLSFVFLVGIAVVVFDNENSGFLTGFLYLSVVGLPMSAAIGLRKNNTGKWNQYILTLPMKRKDIVKSTFLTWLSVLGIGLLVAMGVFSLSFLFHGFPFYRYLDLLLLFTSAVGIALFMSTVFFPLSYFDAKERTESIGIISLLLGIGIMTGIVILLNVLFEKPSDLQLIFFCAGIQALAVFAYILSYFLTARIYLEKEF